MGGGIYLIQENDRLVEMKEQAYDSEDRLQELLEKYPALIGGEQLARQHSQHWLAIVRELATPLEEEGNGRWSHGHIFLDQEAIPTLVEVKRSSDAHTRREMIGQMLEYAANALIYWPVESIVGQFEVNCRESGRDPEQVFEEFLGEEAEEEKFWQKVKTNLQAGRIRLVFVADQIGAEMQRVVEFLNEQLDPTEVLAVEIKQYVSQEGLKTLVPRIIGQTAEAKHKKSSATRERRRWDERSFFEEMATRQGIDEARVAKTIHHWLKMQEPFLSVQWGTGDTYGGFAAKLKHNGGYELFTVDIAGELQISSSVYAAQPAFSQQAKWQELRTRFSEIGLSLPADPTQRRLPSLRLSTLQDKEALNKLLEIFSLVVSELKKSVDT